MDVPAWPDVPCSSARAKGAPMVSYRLTLFGYPSLQRGGERMPLALRKALALLAYLERQRRPIARDTLVDLLWPDAAEETGRASLRRLLHRLRPHVPGLLETEGDAVGIASGAGLSSDAAEIERAAAALAVRPGEQSVTFALAALEGAVAPFLEGFALLGCEAFEEWRRVETERLRALCGQLFRALHVAEIGAGRHDRAVELARRWVAHEPLEEEAHRALIGSLLAAGRSGDARHQAERIHTLLARELGVQPSAETQALLASIDRSNAPALAGTSSATRPETRYVASGGVHIAYQVSGYGERHIVLLPGFVTHLEAMWENPQVAGFLEALGRMGRVIAFDR